MYQLSQSIIYPALSFMIAAVVLLVYKDVHVSESFGVCVQALDANFPTPNSKRMNLG